MQVICSSLQKSGQRAQQSGQVSSSAQKNGGKQKPQGGGGDKDKGAANATPRRAGKCRYCGKAGHWAKECRKAAHDRKKRDKWLTLQTQRKKTGLAC
jgi:hypothetical protein